MIVSIYLEEHEYLIDEPQTINFGGKYIYFFEPNEERLLIKRKLNQKYIEDFFNITNSACKVTLLSAIVGQNGVGKSSVLDIVRKVFVEHTYSLPYNNSTVLVEIDGETKVLQSQYRDIDIVDEDKNNPRSKKSIKIDRDAYQSIYYSPHFDLKYNDNFSEIDKYDISLDQFIKDDLEGTDKKGTNENGWRFHLHEELVFKNSMRQIEFLSSSIFNNNSIFREVFDLPQYETGILYFRDVEIPYSSDLNGNKKLSLHNTPMALRPIISLILEKTENESIDWHIFRDQNSKLDKNLRQALVNKYLLERFIIKAFISVVIQQMEKQNTWLGEGNIKNPPYEMERLKDFSAKDLLFYFIKESYIKRGDYKKSIFNYNEIISFFEKLDLLFEKEINPDNIKKQSIRLNLDELKEILQLHKKIIINLLYYYPTFEGLVVKGDYTDGFIAFRPTDRNMSSGENALLNFFSKLYNFIQSNLIKESKSLSDKENYILLLDEADLGFHPIWKKKYIDAILKTLPYFFESLEIKPKIQIVITTHDPLTLSDLPINNVVFLQKSDENFTMVSDSNNRIQKTFGANITDLLAHSFFVEEGLIGDFSKAKINEVIDWINKSKKLSDIKKSTRKFKNELQYYQSIIKIIDEKIIRIKLTEMITELVPDDNYYNQIIQSEIDHLLSKKR